MIYITSITSRINNANIQKGSMLWGHLRPPSSRTSMREGSIWQLNKQCRTLLEALHLGHRLPRNVEAARATVKADSLNAQGGIS